MSEALPGLPPPPPARPARDATIAVLLREGPSGPEVYWVHRGRSLAFFAGFRAFPGGSVDAADRQVPVAGRAPEEAVLLACAVRELFEEAGVLLLRGGRALGEPERGQWRARLIQGQATLAELLQATGAGLDVDRLVPAGRWLTPPYIPVRFDARMYLVDLRPGEEAEVWPGELASGEWVCPAEALARWAQGETLLHPPQVNALRAIAESKDRAELLQRLREPPHVQGFVTERVEFQQGIRLFPLRTHTLPPATHTNCYFVGNGELLIVDPGASDADEQQRLLSHLRGLMADGLRPKAVFLTHHHGDHLGAVEVLRRELGLPLWCHAETASRAGHAERLLEDGDVLRLEGAPPMELEVLHTPGHARGHLCLFHRPSRALLCGDMVANGSTIIVDPPEGNMRRYLESLERLKALPAGTIYPAHGAPMAEGQAKLDEYLAHRRLRIEAIAAVLQAGSKSVGEIVEAVYSDVPPAIWPIAERSALASLEWLVEEGRALPDGEDRFRGA